METGWCSLQVKWMQTKPGSQDRAWWHQRNEDNLVGGRWPAALGCEKTEDLSGELCRLSVQNNFKCSFHSINRHPVEKGREGRRKTAGWEEK